jgi:hypothetical protein
MGKGLAEKMGRRVVTRALAPAAPPLTRAGPVRRTWGRRPRRLRQASERRWGGRRNESGFSQELAALIYRAI